MLGQIVLVHKLWKYDKCVVQANQYVKQMCLSGHQLSTSKWSPDLLRLHYAIKLIFLPIAMHYFRLALCGIVSCSSELISACRQAYASYTLRFYLYNVMNMLFSGSWPEVDNVVTSVVDNTCWRTNKALGPEQRLDYRRDKHCHFQHGLMVVDVLVRKDLNI